jgi:transcriptional regulator GlxA family with amidase domain
MRINRNRLKENILPWDGKLMPLPRKGSQLKKVKLTRVDHKAVSRSLRFIEENYLQPIPVPKLARVSGMTRRGFIDAFCRHVGQPPATFIRQMRIEQAAQLLIQYDWPLKTIAERSGFKSDNTFCIAFNRITGMPPKKFQRHFWLSTCRRLQGSAKALAPGKIPN